MTADIKKMKEFHFNKFHIMINPDFRYHRETCMIFDKNDNHYIHPDHRIHIFISYDYDDLHDGSFKWFKDVAIQYTRKRIIVHIPRSKKDELYPILRKYESKRLKIIIEKDKTNIPFGYSIYKVIPITDETCILAMKDLVIKSDRDGGYDYKFYV